MKNLESITINSGHVADAVDSQIVMLVKTLQIEHSSTFEEALDTGRDYLNKKVVELMQSSDKENIKKIIIDIKNKFKENPKNKDLESMYKLCKFFGLYKYLE